jgi:hypothetical protein
MKVNTLAHTLLTIASCAASSIPSLEHSIAFDISSQQVLLSQSIASSVSRFVSVTNNTRYEWEEAQALGGGKWECETASIASTDVTAASFQHTAVDCSSSESSLCSRLGETCEVDPARRLSATSAVFSIANAILPDFQDKLLGDDYHYCGFGVSGETAQQCALNSVDACCALHDCPEVKDWPNDCAADNALYRCASQTAASDAPTQGSDIIMAIFSPSSLFPCTKVQEVLDTA